jgi:hypothetical protein
MSKRILVAVLLTVGVLVTWHYAAAQQRGPLPETQKTLIDNMFVRVLEIRVPAGVFEARHSHARGVTVALTDYDNETRQDGGQWVKSHTRSGEVKWAEPVTHEARNTGTTEQHVIRIELK